MNVNITYEDMTRPVAGPEDPFNKKRNKGMNSLAGHVEEQAMDDYAFLVQQRNFEVHGHTLNPGDASVLGQLTEEIKPTKAQKKEMKRKRGEAGDLSVVDGEGSYKGPWAGWEGEREVDPVVEEEAEEWREEKKRRDAAADEAKEKMKVAREEKSIFHGTF